MSKDAKPPVQPGPADAPENVGVAEPVDELAAARREAQEWRDKHLRALADQRNMQARQQREREESLRFAEAALIRELLIVLDDLDRTLRETKPTAQTQPVLDGVSMVREKFVKVLRSHGVERIAALHQPFDPELHEAILQQPTADHAPGTVVMELESGYRMHERVLRPARVAVAAKPEGNQS